MIACSPLHCNLVHSVRWRVCCVPQAVQEGFKKTVFPSLKPTRREDVALLKHWLADTMQQLSVQLPPASDPPTAGVRPAAPP